MLSPTRFAAIPLAILLTGCPSNQTVQSANYSEGDFVRSYSVEFDASDQVMDLVAQFRLNTFTGDSIQLNHPSYVDVDRGELRLRYGDDKFINATGTDYFLSESGAPLAQYTFNWHRQDGSISSDTVVVASSVSIPSALTIDRGKALTLSFGGPPAQSGEVFEALIVTPGVVATIVASQAVGNSVIFPVEEVRGLYLGQGTLRLKRVTTSTKNDAQGRATDGRTFEPFFQPVPLLDSPIPTIHSDAFSVLF